MKNLTSGLIEMTLSFSLVILCLKALTNWTLESVRNSSSPPSMANLGVVSLISSGCVQWKPLVVVRSTTY